MSASNSELLSVLEDGLELRAANGVSSYTINGRTILYDNLTTAIDTILKLRALTSSKRGLSVAQIDRAT